MESSRVRIRRVETLSDDWYTLKKTTFDYRRRDGRWQTQSEDIEVLEVPFDAAMRMVAEGEIADGKTILLLQYAQLSIFPGRDRPARKPVQDLGPGGA